MNLTLQIAVKACVVWVGILLLAFANGALRELVLMPALVKPLSQLHEAYTFKDGNIWSVVLPVTGAAPYVAAKIKAWV